MQAEVSNKLNYQRGCNRDDKYDANRWLILSDFPRSQESDETNHDCCGPLQTGIEAFYVREGAMEYPGPNNRNTATASQTLVRTLAEDYIKFYVP